MNGWILNIVGIAFLGVMVDIIAPTGALKNFIKCIFSVFLIFIIVGPIKNLITSKTIELDNVSANFIEDQDFLIKYNQNLARSYESEIEKKLKNSGIEGVKVAILVSLTDFEFKVLEVSVFMQDLVLTNEINHTNKYEKIKSVIKSILVVQEEIVFYE